MTIEVRYSVLYPPGLAPPLVEKTRGGRSKSPKRVFSEDDEPVVKKKIVIIILKREIEEKREAIKGVPAIENL